MSLRIWLPLTKDLRQQGLDNVTVTNNGATFNSAGKLGGCYYFNRSTPNYLKIDNPLTSSANGVSMAFWVKLPSNGSVNDQLVHIGNGSGWTNNRFTCFVRANNSFLVFVCGDGTNSTQYSCTSSALTLNTWIHVSCIYHNTKMKIYLNGELNKEYTTTIVPSFANVGYIGIGAAPNANEPATAYLNDVRIYDHALSQMEVKELAKGLILHYPLNRNGWGQENLLKVNCCSGGNRATFLENGRRVKINWTSNAGDTYWYLGLASGVTLTENKIYTLSFQCSGLGSNTVSFRWCNLANYEVYLKNGLNTLTFAMPSTSIANPFFDDINRDTSLSDLELWNFKLEEGSIATPWCPNSSDTLATIMGLNSTTEYDCSGFCNNGIRTGTFTWTSNTPKYAVSQVFNGTDNAIQTPSLPTMITDKNYTIAVWIYKIVIGSKSYQTIYGGPSGFEIEARNGGANETKFVPWNWGKPMANYELNEWNHCVFVHSDTDCKIYLNGEYIATGTAKASNPTGNYFIGAWNTATQQNFDGLMSDFRIYATALSASDVKSLYQNCATIDPDGTIRGQIRS